MPGSGSPVTKTTSPTRGVQTGGAGEEDPWQVTTWVTLLRILCVSRRSHDWHPAQNTKPTNDKPKPTHNPSVLQSTNLESVKTTWASAFKALEHVA